MGFVDDLMYRVPISVVIGAVLLYIMTPAPNGLVSNWDGQHHFLHQSSFKPQTTAELANRVVEAREKGERLKVVGSGHSWSDVAVPYPGGVQVDMSSMSDVLKVDVQTGRVLVEAGATLKALNNHLDKHNLAFPNLGSVSEQTVAGAISTGTHGTGLGFPNLPSMVTKLTVVNGEGRVIEIGEDSEELKAFALSVGALGIITHVEFQAVPAFRLKEELRMYSDDEFFAQMDDIVQSNRHIKLWWVPYAKQSLITTANPTTEEPYADVSNVVGEARSAVNEGLQWLDSMVPALTPYHMKLISKTFAEESRVDTSHRIFNIPFRIAVHQESEYAIPYSSCKAFLKEFGQLIDDGALYSNFITEVRFVKGDEFWLSPSYQQDSCYVTYLLYNLGAQRTMELYTKFKELAYKYGGRPHWGKTWTEDKEQVEKMFPKFSEFAALRDKHDPDGVFVNAAIGRLFGLP